MAEKNILTELPAEKLQQVLDSLEKERQRRAEGKPAAPEPTVVERVIMPDLDVEHHSTSIDTKVRKQPKKARKAKLTPVPFYVFTTPKAVGDDPGAIAESYYVTRGRELALCDASGTPTEWHPISERGPLRTAQQLLKQRLAARRGPGPDHGPIRYFKTGWM